MQAVEPGMSVVTVAAQVRELRRAKEAQIALISKYRFCYFRIQLHDRSCVRPPLLLIARSILVNNRQRVARRRITVHTVTAPMRYGEKR